MKGLALPRCGFSAELHYLAQSRACHTEMTGHFLPIIARNYCACNNETLPELRTFGTLLFGMPFSVTCNVRS